MTRSLNSIIGGDDVELTGGTATFDNKNVGTGKTVTLSGATLAGTDAANYSLTSVGTATADITARNLTVSATGINKVYDGTVVATVSLSTDKVAGDDVTASYASASFDNKNVGTGKPVSVSGISISGADAGNYNLLNTTAATTANITARNLTVSATGINKVYDGTVVATVSLSTDKVAGDDVTASYASASFDNKNVGTGKPVSVSGISISGADAGNYNLLNTTAATTADITAKPITGNFTAADKVWDGNTSATITGRSLNDVVPGDGVTLIGGTATFANANVGSNKVVTGVGFGLTGPDAGNYTLVSTTLTTSASILAWSAVGTGFYQPVGVPNSVFTPSGTVPNPPAVTPTTVWNTIKGGQTVPLKFQVFAGTVEKTSLSDIVAFTQTKLNSCDSGAGTEELEATLLTTGGTSLRYSGQWIQNWQTPKVSGEACYRATVTFADGSSLSAFFRVRK